jgi:hypothetical protein
MFIIMGGVVTTVARTSKRGAAPGERRGGRVKGTPNKITAQLKDMILQALDEAGGVEYLLEQASSNPTAFLTLVGKVLPLQVTGENGGAIQVERVERVFTRPQPHEQPSIQ